MIEAATVAAWILSKPAWLDRDVTREQRAPIVEMYATAIVDASRNDTDVAMLLSLARHEASFSVRIGGGNCPARACDHGRARGWFQLHESACRAAWAFDAGTVESVREEARCALSQLKHHGWRCREHSLTPMMGAFSGYATGGDCHWAGAGARVMTVRRIAAELLKAEAKQ